MRRLIERIFSREIGAFRRFLTRWRKKPSSMSASPSTSRRSVTEKPSHSPPKAHHPQPKTHHPAAEKGSPKKAKPPLRPREKRVDATSQKKTAPRASSQKKFPVSPSPHNKRVDSRKSSAKPNRIAPQRGKHLAREIAKTPEDPFASTVGSAVFHLVLLLILIPFLTPQPSPPPEPSRLVIRYIPREESQPEKETPTPEKTPPEITEEKPVLPVPDTEEISDPSPPGNTEAQTQPKVFSSDADSSHTPTGRTGKGRVKALSLHGGNAQTESAVAAGIDWLIRHQSPEGNWAPERFDKRCADTENPCDGLGYAEHQAGITSLALLALLGDGHVPSASGSTREQSAFLALSWLIDHQDKTGCIRSAKGDAPRNMYDHGIATFALCEAAQLMRDPVIEKKALLALTFIEEAQQPGGGWDYFPSPTLRNDLSITGWQVLAIQAGRKLGFLPSHRLTEKLNRFLQRSIKPSGRATYADRGRGRGRGGYGIDAVGLLTRIIHGESPHSLQSRQISADLLRHLPAPTEREDWDREPQSMYYWYTATLALFHVGGAAWDTWNSSLQEFVLPIQHTVGEQRGSWDPDPNWIGKAGGRVAQTALGVLTFETYFRYTPIYRQLGSKP